MKKYYVYTFGCKVNQYESQLISEKFENDGLRRVERPEEADVVIFNSCTVTEKADKECKYFLRKTLKLANKPKVLLTGCLAKNINVDSSLQNIEVITDKTKLYGNSQNQVAKKFDNHSRAFLKIQDGCNNFCSYCIVPYVRNILWSKQKKDVLSEIETLVKTGYSEIVLTGIHIGKYQGGLFDLIGKIIKIPLTFRIRISSIELNEIDDNLVKLMQENPDKICNHLHIPLQSGSDAILKSMNRKYLTKTFENKISKTMKALPYLALTTDIITGFPGETEKHHNETCDFVKRIPFARFHIFRYSDRQGTKAYMLDKKVPSGEIKKRYQDLTKIDSNKRLNFLRQNMGLVRKAVKIGEDKALTDNYITIKDRNKKLNKKNGIFEIEVAESSSI